MISGKIPVKTCKLCTGVAEKTLRASLKAAFWTGSKAWYNLVNTEEYTVET